MGEVEIEVPFPADPECLLTWEDDWPADAVGYITFIDPKQDDWWPGTRRTSIPVTRRAGGYGAGEHPTHNLVWEFRDVEPGIITTHPSIHALGRWHSPNPTRWRVVEHLSDEAN